MFFNKKDEEMTANASVNELNFQEVVATPAEDEETDVLGPLVETTNSMIRTHPLENTWTLWHWENDRSKNWSDMLNEVASFNTVEDFWSVYYYIKPPSEIRMMNDYMLFKHGIRPMWEDDENKHGGRWITLLSKNSRIILDKIWHDLLLILIGENFIHSDQICGAVVNIRNRANKISIWTKDADNEKAILEIGHKLKELLPLDDIGIHYQVHSEAMVQHGPAVNSLYRL